MLRRFVRQVAKASIYRKGSIATIRLGPLRGCRYVVDEDSGWAPIIGGWEPGAQAVYCRFVKRGDVVYDLGANTGLHSLLFSRLVGTSGQVIAFEPVPNNVKHIDRVIHLNRTRNIRVISKAVSDITGNICFCLGENHKQGHIARVGDIEHTLYVPAVTLDDFVANGAPKPDFIKIDIEGSEGPALSGFSETLELCQPIFSIDLHSPEQDRAVGKFLSERDYKIFRYPSQQRNALDQLSFVKSPDLGWPNPDGVWGTILAVPKGFELGMTVDQGR